MIKLYYGSSEEAIEWRIYLDYKDQPRYLLSIKNPWDISDQICQQNLFQQLDSNNVFAVNITSWKLTDDKTKQAIEDLSKCEPTVIMYIVSSSVKNKIFSSLKIESVKCNSISKITKTNTINKIIQEKQLNLEPKLIETLIEMLPTNINSVKNEIWKLQLLNKESITEQDLKNIIFEMGDATIFNIVDSWLKHDNNKVIERLNDLISKNVLIQLLVPIFSLKLFQIKLFLKAKISKWPNDVIANKISIPIWQQMNYIGLKPYDKTLEIIDVTLDELYKFDINVKKQKNIAYTQFIKILLK